MEFPFITFNTTSSFTKSLLFNVFVISLKPMPYLEDISLA